MNARLKIIASTTDWDLAVHTVVNMIRNGNINKKAVTDFLAEDPWDQFRRPVFRHALKLVRGLPSGCVKGGIPNWLPKLLEMRQ